MALSHVSHPLGPGPVLERFIVGEGDVLPASELLDEAGLLAFAASRTLDGPPPAMQFATLAATARHAAIRSELGRLLGRWSGAGIEVLLFKGFHLAEFVYPSPSMRTYSDVDVLIRSDRTTTAAQLARECGWVELWHADEDESLASVRSASYQGHEVLQLRHERLGVQLDVHRRLVHNNHNRIARFRAQERITRLAWGSSLRRELAGTVVRELHPLDAVLVGLVLNRCWSPEDWALRPHDYLDFKYLIERYDLTLDRLRERASELECPRTFEIFLERCDPFRTRFDLSRPGPVELHRWNLAVAPERGNRYLERSLVGLRGCVTAPLELIREFPTVARTLLLAKGGADAKRVAMLIERPIDRPRKLRAEEWRGIRRGVHRGLRLLAARTEERRNLEGLALLGALRRRKIAARLLWEADSDGAERPYLELDGERLNLGGTLLA